MANIQIYTKDWCSYCANSKRILTSRGFSFEEIDITENPALEQEITERTGQRTVPQIFVDDNHIGGFTELARSLAKGELDHLKQVA